MPIKGSQKLAVLLCKFKDTAQTEQQSKAFFEDLFVKRGTGGLNDYWIDASLGAINLDGTEVFNWKTIDKDRDDYINDHPDRASKIQGAVDEHEVDRSRYAGIVALFNADPGNAGAAGGVLGGPGQFNVTFLAHETGHVFGIDHSYDQSMRKRTSWSAPGEYYDRHDIMSAMNVFSHTHPRFDARGPLLCAANLDLMQWLPASRMWKEPIRSSFSECFDLVSLGHPEIPGYLAATIGGYHVEFRTKDRWDVGIPRAGVLIHDVSGSNAIIMASDNANWVNDWQPGQSFGPSQVQLTITGGTRISVASIDAEHKKARICVTRTAEKRQGAQIYGSIVISGSQIYLKEVFIRIPPKGGPLREMVEGPIQFNQRGAIDEQIQGKLSIEITQQMIEALQKEKPQ